MNDSQFKELLKKVFRPKPASDEVLKKLGTLIENEIATMTGIPGYRVECEFGDEEKTVLKVAVQVPITCEYVVMQFGDKE